MGKSIGEEQSREGHPCSVRAVFYIPICAIVNSVAMNATCCHGFINGSFQKSFDTMVGCSQKPRLFIASRAFNPFALPMGLRLLKLEQLSRREPIEEEHRLVERFQSLRVRANFL